MEFALQIGLTNAVVSALLALIVLGLTFVIRNPFIIRGLWLLVLVKLIAPPLFSIPTPLGIQTTGSLTEVQRVESSSDQQSLDTDQRPERMTGSIDTTSMVSPMPEPPGMTSTLDDIPADSDTRMTPQEPAADTAVLWQRLARILAFGWIASSLVWLGLFLVRIRRFHRMLAGSVAASSRICLEANRIADRFGMSRCPPIRLTDATIPPLVWALPGRVQVILPSKLMEQLNDQQVSMILAHELMHVRRRDHWVRWIEVLIFAIYWWNPVAWWASRRLRDAEEICCDTWVLKHFQEQNYVYGETLVRTLEYLSRFGKSSPVLASSFGKKNATEERVEMILKNQLKQPLSVYLRRTLLLLAIVVLPLSVSGSEAESDGQGGNETTVVGSSTENRSASTAKQDEAEELGRKIEAKVKELSKENGFSGVVLVELGGDVVAHFGVGTRDDEGKANNLKTLFEVGSTTKPITALALLALEEQGKLSLDDSISQYLPNVPDDCEDITIRHLMQHTSGIPGTNYGPHTNDVAEVTPIYLNGGPQHPPGTNFEYWNQGYALLSAIVATAADQDYTEAIRELVYEPTEMKRSCFTGDDPSKHSNVAIGKATRGQNRSALDPPYGDFYGLQYRGMGGAVCTASDLHKMITSLRSREFLEADSLEAMLKAGPGNYGLGWFVTQLSDDQRRISHGGSVRGFLTAVDWYPDDDSCMIMLANTDDRAVFYQIESAVREMLEPEFVKVPEQRQFSEEFIDSIVGIYTLGSREVSVQHDGKQLNIVIDWAGPKSYGVLEKGEGDVLNFVGPTPEDVVEVTPKFEGGKVQSLTFFDKEYTRKD